MKLRTIHALYAAFCIAAAGFAPAARAATCTINGSVAWQPIDGFGFSSAWSGAMSSSLSDTMFGTSSGQLGFSLLRIRIDPTQNWGNETTNASMAHARGVKVFGTPWSPPAAMKTSNNVVHGSLLTTQYANYATYLNQAISSIGLDYISLQNEPDWDPTYEGCTWTADNFHTFMTNNASVLTKPIIMPESLNFNDSMSDPTLNDPITAARVTIVGGHFYGNGNYVHTNALSKGKHVWETEHSINGVDDITACMQVAKEVSDAMNNQFSAYSWWWLAPTDTNAGLVDTNGQPHKNAYTLGQFARFVRPGMTRVDSTYNPSTNVYVTAYKNGTTLSIVAVNTGTSAVSQTFALTNASATSLSAVRTSSSESMASVPAATVSGGSFTYSLPAQSVTTFTGPIGNVTGTTYTLNVTTYGSGTVTSSTGGINCGTTCSTTLASGTAVTLTAKPASGATFSGWNGACAGTGTCIVTMTQAQWITATFTTAGPVSINAGGAASGNFLADVDYSGGSVYSTTNTIDTTLLSSPVPPQAVLQTERYGAFTYTIPGLTAGSPYTVTLYFVESYWTAAGQRLFNVAINGSSVLSAFDIFAAAGGQNKAIARTFNATANSSGQVVIAFTAGSVDNPKVCGVAIGTGSVSTGYTLSVTRSGSGSGTVAGGAINCGSTCSASNLASGTTVTLTATAASGSTFSGWSGACTGTGACVVTMTANQAVTATFGTSGGGGTCTAVSGGHSGNFNTTGAICFTVTGTINGWGCSSADGRTVTVNGTAVTCGQMPLPGSSPYTFSFSAGSYPWATLYWW
jgi:glucuronoarabinoxylan endo-1,4-beta-xylanase